MCERMVHRGPDSEGLMVLRALLLACGGWRSSISLPENNRRAMKIRAWRSYLNGEIYNYRELRRELEKRGRSFRSMSDTEVIPHLYAEYGDEMVEKLERHVCVCACGTSTRRRLLIARDRFGEKPLYWGVFDNTLALRVRTQSTAGPSCSYQLAESGSTPSIFFL